MEPTSKWRCGPQTEMASPGIVATDVVVRSWFQPRPLCGSLSFLQNLKESDSFTSARLTQVEAEPRAPPERDEGSISMERRRLSDAACEVELHKHRTLAASKAGRTSAKRKCSESGKVSARAERANSFHIREDLQLRQHTDRLVTAINLRHREAEVYTCHTLWSFC